MRIGVLGTGMVGHAIGSRLVEVGHDVVMGSRTAGNEKAVAWAASQPERAAAGTFADAAAHGELLVNATGGTVSLDVLGGVRRGGPRGQGAGRRVEPDGVARAAAARPGHATTASPSSSSARTRRCGS